MRGSARSASIIANTVDPQTLAPFLPRLALIDIAFPAFSDGRGFSIARLLRNAGYAGVLRAVGRLIADQFAYAIGCGFDEVELPDDARRSVSRRSQLGDGAARCAASLISAAMPAARRILERRRAAQRGIA